MNQSTNNWLGGGPLWVAWAFEQKLGTGEKLVLVYLAWVASAEGVGRYVRAELQRVTDYEPRSLQRILKNLRDAGLLHDRGGDWYQLGTAVPETLEVPHMPDTSRAVAGRVPVAPPGGLEDWDSAGETIARHVDEASDRLVARMNDQTMRLLAGMQRLVSDLAADLPPAPPPDPVLESRPYLAAVARGMDHENAYALARELLEQAEEPPAIDSHARSMRSQERPRAAAAVGTGNTSPAPGVDGGAYPDDAEGRARRVWDILHGKPARPEAWAEILPAWEALEDSENSNRTSGTVEGETPAFELLYPAIVAAAKRVRATMTMREFMDPVAVAEGRAPWDKPAEPAGATDAQLQVEVERMLDEIGRANHPQVPVPERVTEKGDDNVTRTENLKTFYLRVKRVHQQLQHLQQMGV